MPQALPALVSSNPTSISFSAAADKSELVFDAEGNMVLAVSSGPSTDRVASAAEATTTVESATCGYDFAYRRPKPTKWSKEDTLRFYEALELYGSDQMLINTMLPQFTAVQIRQKFKAEERNAPAHFTKALYGSKKKLNSVKFEEQHGTILNPVLDYKTESSASLEDAIGALVDSVIDRPSPKKQTPRKSTVSVKPSQADALDALFM